MELAGVSLHCERVRRRLASSCSPVRSWVSSRDLSCSFDVAFGTGPHLVPSSGRPVRVTSADVSRRPFQCQLGCVAAGRGPERWKPVGFSAPSWRYRGAAMADDNDAKKDEIDRAAPTRTRRSTINPEQDEQTNVLSTLESTAASEAGPDVLLGRTLLHFELQRRIGEGGMGVVYEAHDARLNRRVAIKVVQPRAIADADARARLFREARRAAAVSDPAIAAVFEIHDEHEPPFFVMEFVDGQNLRTRLRAGRLTVSHSIDIGLQIARALQGAHAVGIVHRDVKPENVLVEPSGRIKLLDFGIAKQLPASQPESSAATDGPALTAEGRILGTPEYMAPEQALGRQIDARADVFSLGVVLYEMLAGIRPFKRPSPLETAVAVARDEPPDLKNLKPEVPFWLRSVVARCLSKEPDGRFADASDLATHLEKHRAAGRSLALRPTLLASGLLLLGGAMIYGVAHVGRSRAPQPPTTSAETTFHPVSARAVREVSSGPYKGTRISPKGNVLAQSGAENSLRLIDTTTGIARDIPIPTACRSNLFACLSDGESLLVAKKEAERTTLWRVAASTGAGSPLFSVPIALSRLEMAPDGQRIAAIDGHDGRIIRLANGEITRLPKPPEGGDVDDIAWSRDGSSLAVTVELELQVPGGRAIEILSADATTRRRLPVQPRLGVMGGASRVVWGRLRRANVHARRRAAVGSGRSLGALRGRASAGRPSAQMHTLSAGRLHDRTSCRCQWRASCYSARKRSRGDVARLSDERHHDSSRSRTRRPSGRFPAWWRGDGVLVESRCTHDSCDTVAMGRRRAFTDSPSDPRTGNWRTHPCRWARSLLDVSRRQAESCRPRARRLGANCRGGSFDASNVLLSNHRRGVFSCETSERALRQVGLMRQMGVSGRKSMHGRPITMVGYSPTTAEHCSRLPRHRSSKSTWTPVFCRNSCERIRTKIGGYGTSSCATHRHGKSARRHGSLDCSATHWAGLRKSK